MSDLTSKKYSIVFTDHLIDFEISENGRVAVTNDHPKLARAYTCDHI